MSGYVYYGNEVRYASGDEFDNLTRKGWITREDAPTTADNEYPFWNTETHQWEIREKEQKEAKWDSFDFFLRFTKNERYAIAIASETDKVVDDFRILCASCGVVKLDNPLTQSGMNYLVYKGIITKERRDQILDVNWNNLS